jgi:autotransporter adhesin
MAIGFCRIALTCSVGFLGINSVPALAGPTVDCTGALTVGVLECGSYSDSSGEDSTALGYAAYALNFASTAVGSKADAAISSTVVGAYGHSYDSGVAIGLRANVNPKETKGGGYAGVAIGLFANVSADDSIAIGRNADAYAPESVALGADSIADQANTVSVGFVGGERRIVNVAAGIADTDAVNVSQLKAAGQAMAAQESQIASNTTQIAASKSAIAAQDRQIATLQAFETDHENRISALEQLGSSFDLLDGRLDGIELHNRKQDKAIRSANEGVAMAMAMDTPVLLPGERIAVTGGLGYYSNRVAGAASMGFRLTDRASMSLGVGIAPKSGKAGGKVGFRMGW